MDTCVSLRSHDIRGRTRDICLVYELMTFEKMMCLTFHYTIFFYLFNKKMNFVKADEMQTIFIIDTHSDIDIEKRKEKKKKYCRKTCCIT